MPSTPDLAPRRVHLLQTGAFRLDGGGMFGLVPKTMWSQWIAADESNRIPLATRSLLVESTDGLVLVEAGCGDKWTDRERAMYALEPRTAVDALAEAGVDPRGIAHVVVTHLHFDHAGGLTRAGAAGPEPVFPNARIHVQRQEWLDALANRSTMTKTYLRTHLDPVAAQVELHDGASTPLAGITLLPTPGHTWGHQSVVVDGVAIEAAAAEPTRTTRPTPAGAPPRTILFTGDVCPTIHHAHPAASLGYDMMAYEAMRSKQEILGRAHAEGWLVALDHDASHALARTTERDGRIALEPFDASRG